MGVVTDFLPGTRSKGRDWTCNFRLADHTTFDEGIKVRYFRPMETELPPVQANGDVVLLQKLKISAWSGMTVGLSSRNTVWTVFPAASIPEKQPVGRTHLRFIKDKGSSAPTEEQMRYAIELCNSRDRGIYEASPTDVTPAATNQTQTSVGTTSAAGTPSFVGRREKFALVKDLQINMFYDLVGQVVKIYPSNGVVELYITDYTSNNLLFDYAWGHGDDESSALPKWRGPLGRNTLTVSLFPPHSYYAQSNVEEDQYVFLRNTRIKYSKDLKMEGSLHTDRVNPDRVDITIITNMNDDRVKDLLRRKLDYTKQWSKDKDAFVSLAQGQKRKQNEEPKLSKGQARKRRKQQREEEARKKEQQPAPSENEEEDKENTEPFRVRITPNLKSHSYQHNHHSTPASSPPPREPPSKSTSLNKSIRASNQDIPIRSLASILNHETFTIPKGASFALPFHNIRSRAAVRVVDFYPRDIADFAVKKKPRSEYDVLSDYEGDSDSSDDDDKKPKLPPDTDEEDGRKDDQSAQSDTDGSDQEKSNWEWRFTLVLEDASAPTNPREPNERMTLYVGDADAEFLLKLNACDLRRKPLRLAALGEKLFLLWGDLEERMRVADEREDVDGGKGVRSIPFLCCIKEYGVRSLRRPRRPSVIPDNGELGCDDRVSVQVEHDENLGWERRFRMFGTTIL